MRAERIARRNAQIILHVSSYLPGHRKIGKLDIIILEMEPPQKYADLRLPRIETASFDRFIGLHG
jgi:hypothetical protein